MNKKVNWSELIPKDVVNIDLTLQRKGEELAKVAVFQSLENSRLIYERKLILKDLIITESEDNFRKLFIKFATLYLWWFQYYIFKMTQLNPREHGLITQKFTETLLDKIAIFAWGPEWLKEFKDQYDSENRNYEGKVFLDPENLHNSVVWQFSKDVLDIFGVHEDAFKTLEVQTLALNCVEFLNLPELLNQ